MKKIIPHLKIGDKVLAKVHEAIGSNILIVSVQGDLLRVINETRKEYKKDQSLMLYVCALHPLKFKLNASTNNNSKRRLSAHI